MDWAMVNVKKTVSAVELVRLVWAEGRSPAEDGGDDGPSLTGAPRLMDGLYRAPTTYQQDPYYRLQTIRQITLLQATYHPDATAFYPSRQCTSERG